MSQHLCLKTKIKQRHLYIQVHKHLYMRFKFYIKIITENTYVRYKIYLIVRVGPYNYVEKCALEEK